MIRRLFGLIFCAVVVRAAPYRLEDVALPAAMSPEVSAVAFSPGGRLVVANRHGEIWTCDPAKLDWRRFAYGLHEPLGVFAASESEIYVTQRPELTRVRDTNGDGLADEYLTVNGEWGITDNWHEFAFGLRRDAEGNFVVAVGLPDLAGPLNQLNPRTPLDLRKVHKEPKPSAGHWQGWALKITPGGGVIPWACGFREPAGVGLSPAGEMFITDQQGDYIASSALVHVRRGRFYGHPASLKWSPGWSALPATTEELEALRSPPAIILPHGSLGGSPGEPVWDTTSGKFGPFTGQVFVGDFTKLISRLDLEMVAGEYQGACFAFLRDEVGSEGIRNNRGSDNLTIPAGGLQYFRDAPPLTGTRLRQGNNRLAFSPDGSLYLGQTTRGWGQGDGLQRLVWTGATPIEIRTMRLTERGFDLSFTVPMQRESLADARHYRVARFRYLYSNAYGSPRVDVAPVNVTSVTVSSDASRVSLALSELEPGFVYELELQNVVSAAGEAVANPQGYYTINRLLSGRVFQGRLDRALREPAAVASGRARADVENGRRVYRAYCAACHQENGKGGGVPGVAAADFTAEKSALTKTDAELLQTIAAGVESKGMPPFGNSLSAAERSDALAYIRRTFQARK